MRQRPDRTGGICPAQQLSSPTSPAFKLQTAEDIHDAMDDMHAPTVSSGPTSSGASNGIPKAQLSLQELISEKDRVETELKALGQVLDSVRMQWFSA